MTETERRLTAINDALEKMRTDLGTAKELLDIIKAYVLEQTSQEPLPTPEESQVLLALYKLETILN